MLSYPYLCYPYLSFHQTVSGDERCGLSLLEALTYDHLNVGFGTVRDPKSLVTYSLGDAIQQKLIDGYSALFTSPTSSHTWTVEDAIRDGELDLYGNWVRQAGKGAATSSSEVAKDSTDDSSTAVKRSEMKDSEMRSLSLEESLSRGYMRLLPAREPVELRLTETHSVSVHYVIHPVSMNKVDYRSAVSNGTHQFISSL